MAIIIMDIIITTTIISNAVKGIMMPLIYLLIWMLHLHKTQGVKGTL